MFHLQITCKENLKDISFVTWDSHGYFDKIATTSIKQSIELNSINFDCVNFWIGSWIKKLASLNSSLHDHESSLINIVLENPSQSLFGHAYVQG